MHNIRINAMHQLFRSLANKNRLVMLENLMETDLTVSEIAELLDMSHSNTSHNLSALRKSGLVSMKKQGKYKTVSVNRKIVDALFKVVKDHLGLEE
jgi:DNA-binding transcriptional ArsR family regulator